ncbi:MAG: SURF1 family protein [Alcanivoracaceae bacterium]|nr:SURF1 family protein [Alcanivoracaceae bacterium]
MSSRRFHLHWFALIVAVLVAAFCARLGVWQLQRATEKEALISTIEARGQHAPIPLSTLLAKSDAAHFPVQLQGTFDNRHNVLLDNRILEGVAGYFLITPFKTTDGHWLLVNRGWLPRGADRAKLPSITAIEGDVSVTGHTYLYSSKTFTLADDNLEHAQWPVRVQKIEMQAIGQLLGVELAPFEIRVDPAATLEAGPQLARPWQDATEAILGPERHRAYAVQWFSLAVMALLVFFAASFRKTAS